MSNLNKTKLLVLISVLATFFSTLSIRAGYGELYPFFDWSLFTKPPAITDTVSTIGIAYYSKGDAAALSIPNNGDKIKKDKFINILYNLAKEYREHKNDSLYRNRLVTWGKYLKPGQDCYCLIEKNYLLEGKKVKRLPNQLIDCACDTDN